MTESTTQDSASDIRNEMENVAGFEFTQGTTSGVNVVTNNSGISMPQGAEKLDTSHQNGSDTQQLRPVTPDLQGTESLSSHKDISGFSEQMYFAEKTIYGNSFNLNTNGGYDPYNNSF